MREIRFDSVGGAAGDMILASLAGLGANLNAIEKILNKAIHDDEFEIITSEFSDYGMSGLKLEVRITKASGKERSLHEIEHIIDRADMTPRAKELSHKVFGRLAEAEATVHKCHAHHIHFHEVGAVDSIVDILGSCMALDQLNVDRISFGPLPEGCGTFKCRHGIYPIPAPATLELLKGINVIQTDEPFEMITPTGAALLTTMPGGQSNSIGTGMVCASASSFGMRKLNGRPNLLRATLIEVGVENGHSHVIQLETNLDDVTPEIIGALFEKLLTQGALDVWTTQIQMKKQRPGVLLSLLAEPNESEALRNIIFRETGTLGIRTREVERVILRREFTEIETKFGTVRIKTAYLDNEKISTKPEFEDCRILAEKHGVPLKDVIASALAKLS